MCIRDRAGAEAASVLSGGSGRGELGRRRRAARPSGPPASLDLQGILRCAPGADSNSEEFLAGAEAASAPSGGGSQMGVRGECVCV
eukprot:1691822-Alexandrium_andersonii.AAC.1